ncbi:MAG: RagB/SusD family nutrient uptake outer membrane protein [Paraprevotella sp.]|nr:RagB/SusD family nutrient uptake outer membrane protein [Paraprevotella sp.]
MIRIFKKMSYIGCLAALALSAGSCSDLLEQESTVDLPATDFWNTVNDAEYGLNGMVADIRHLFDRDYYLDGMGEFVRVRGNSFSADETGTDGRDGRAYRGLWKIRPIGYGGGWDEMYRYCYGGVNRINYVMDNVEKMIARNSDASTIEQLETILGECRLMRALVYFRLISWWGNVPYIDWRVYDNSEVASISRTPIETIKDSILSDLDYAFDKLPVKAETQGRFAKPAALALRGKVLLYWASWNDYGWPELDTFTPSAEKAKQAYKDAADAFKHVIDDYGLTLFRNGEPGDFDGLGSAENLPNYYYLFLPSANGDPEFILAFNHGGEGTDQG